MGLKVLYEDGKGLFMEMDTNGDNFVTVEELSKWASADHEESHAKETELNKKTESFQRTNATAHSKTIIDTQVSYGGIINSDGIVDQREHYYSNGSKMSQGRTTSALFGQKHRDGYREERADNKRKARRIQLFNKLQDTL